LYFVKKKNILINFKKMKRPEIFEGIFGVEEISDRTTMYVIKFERGI